MAEIHIFSNSTPEQRKKRAYDRQFEQWKQSLPGLGKQWKPKAQDFQGTQQKIGEKRL